MMRSALIQSVLAAAGGSGGGSAPIEFVAMSARATSASSPISPSLPAGLANNDLLIAGCYSWGGSGALYSDESGWTKQTSVSLSSRNTATFNKFAANESAPSFDVSSTNLSAFLGAWRNVNAVALLDREYQSTSTTSHVVKTVTATQPCVLVWVVCVEFYGSSITNLNGWTQRAAGGSNNFGSILIAEQVVSGAGSISGFTASHGGNARISGVCLELT